MAISVVINTYNSSGIIRQAINAARGFDEIVVCDLESDDNTTEIAMNEGCKVVVFPRGNARSADPARNFAIHSASSQWVLVIDADEIITPDLHDYLYNFIKNPGDVKGLYIPRMNFVVNIWKRSSYPDYQLRFFDRDYVYWPAKERSVPQIDGIIRKIPARKRKLALRHLAPTISDTIRKINIQSDIDAEKENHLPVSLGRIAINPWLVFLKVYFLKGAWRYGAAGFISARNDSIRQYFRLAKLFEKNSQKK